MWGNYNIGSKGVMGQNQAQEKSPHGAMANASATIIGHEGTDVGPI